MRRERASGIAQSVQTRLRAKADREDRPYQELLQLYGIERFLYRLARSRHREGLVLKGALLLRLWLGLDSRPTRDIDLLGLYLVLDDGREPINIYEGTGRCVLHVGFESMGSGDEWAEARRTIAEYFNAIPGVELDPERPYPGIRFDRLDGTEETVLGALDAMLERLDLAARPDTDPPQTD